MKTVKQIKNEIGRLLRKNYWEVRNWMTSKANRAWDKEFEDNLSDWEKQVLDRRYEEHLKNPTSGSPWNEVKQRIRNNYKQNNKNSV